MAAILRPAVRLMERFPLPAKGAAVAACVALPLALLTVESWTASGAQLAAAERGREAIAAVRAIVPALVLTQRELLVPAGAAAAAGSDPAALAAALAKLASAGARMEVLGAREQVAAVAARQLELERASAPGAPSAARAAAAEALAEALSGLALAIGEQAGLAQDPEPALAILARVALWDALAMIDEVARIGRPAPEAAAAGAPAEASAIALAAGARVLDRVLEAQQAGLRRAARDDPPALHAAEAGRHLDPVRALVARARSGGRDAAPGQPAAATFAAAAAAALDGERALAERALAAIDARLADRADTLARARTLRAAVLALGLALAAYSATAFYYSVRGGLRAVDRAVQRLATGDLAQTIAPRGRDEITDTLQAFRGALEQLAGAMRSVYDSTDEIVAASGAIAAGNFDLARRTRESGDAIATTSARMIELAERVRQDTGSAREVDQLMQQVRQAADGSRRIVDDLGACMQGIRRHGRQIGEVVGIIDALAFQTNLLALNASVEAAHAGERGRGFAIVAQEVRALAQRSAESARRIAGIVAAADEQIGAGERLAATAGERAEDTRRAAVEAAALMERLSAAAERQREAVEEVGASIERLTEATCANAELVTRNGAMADRLAAGGQMLYEQVHRFALEREAAAGRGPA